MRTLADLVADLRRRLDEFEAGPGPKDKRGPTKYRRPTAEAHAWGMIRHALTQLDDPDPNVRDLAIFRLGGYVERLEHLGPSRGGLKGRGISIWPLRDKYLEIYDRSTGTLEQRRAKTLMAIPSDPKPPTDNRLRNWIRCRDQAQRDEYLIGRRPRPKKK